MMKTFGLLLLSLFSVFLFFLDQLLKKVNAKLIDHLLGLDKKRRDNRNMVELTWSFIFDIVLFRIITVVIVVPIILFLVVVITYTDIHYYTRIGSFLILANVVILYGWLAYHVYKKYNTPKS